MQNKYLIKHLLDGKPNSNDKYYCEGTLNHNLSSFISANYPRKNEWNYMCNMVFYELTTCDCNCSTISYNNTCSPITYRYGHYAQYECDKCEDSSWHLNCGREHTPISLMISIRYVMIMIGSSSLPSYLQCQYGGISSRFIS